MSPRQTAVAFDHECPARGCDRRRSPGRALPPWRRSTGLGARGATAGREHAGPATAEPRSAAAATWGTGQVEDRRTLWARRYGAGRQVDGGRVDSGGRGPASGREPRRGRRSPHVLQRQSGRRRILWRRGRLRSRLGCGGVRLLVVEAAVRWRLRAEVMSERCRADRHAGDRCGLRAVMIGGDRRQTGSANGVSTGRWDTARPAAVPLGGAYGACAGAPVMRGCWRVWRWHRLRRRRLWRRRWRRGGCGVTQSE